MMKDKVAVENDIVDHLSHLIRWTLLMQEYDIEIKERQELTMSLLITSLSS